MNSVKRYFALFLVLTMAVFALTSCNSLAKTDTLGNKWSGDWVNVGLLLGIDKKAGQLEFVEYNDALSLNGIDYAKWAFGEPEKYINDENKETELYPAEAYILLQEFPDKESVLPAIKEWKELEAKSYGMDEGKSILCGEQKFEVFSLSPKSESPYSGGLAAFGEHGNFAVSIELMFTEKFNGKADDILREFLESFHYRAEKNS